MADLSELCKQLEELPARQYSEVIQKVDAQRREAAAREEREHPPHSGMSKDDFARWIARYHFSFDKGISRILYLPTDSPPGEVRLLEINELIGIPENAPIAAVDFMPDIAGINYSIFVADITP